MAKKAISSEKRSAKGKGATKRSPKSEASKSRTSRSSSSSASPKGSAKGSGIGSFGKKTIGKGCLPTVLTGMLIMIAIIIF